VESAGPFDGEDPQLEQEYPATNPTLLSDGKTIMHVAICAFPETIFGSDRLKPDLPKRQP
jgi:hypothetical protein